MTIYIKNMVCNRCIAFVKTELKQLGYQKVNVTLGEVHFEKKELLDDEILKINEALLPHGFEVIDNKINKLIEKIKLLVIEQIHYGSKNLKVKIFQHFAPKLCLVSILLSKPFWRKFRTFSLGQPASWKKRMMSGEVMCQLCM